jgi:hypothetical protein
MGEKLLKEDEFLVAIRTGLDFWYILSRRGMHSVPEAEEYANKFKDTYDTAILKVYTVVEADTPTIK